MLRCRRLLALALILIVLGVAHSQPIIRLGSKTDPEAHLFTYDQKFRESTRFMNYNLSMVGEKEFEDCSRLSSRMDLRMFPSWTELVINANFSGIGRMGYVVYDEEREQPREEQSTITHMFIGNFSMDERLLVAKNHAVESGYLPPV
ncbi:MAG: hypothetical protein N3G75_04995 [Methanothrix sp.]|nr:hypothetical protein [Methanothrix sp.]MCX8207173.1 hypothetical protein [Methanothrix sp.]